MSLLAERSLVDDGAPALPAESSEETAAPPNGRGLDHVPATRHGLDLLVHHPLARRNVTHSSLAESTHATPPLVLRQCLYAHTAI